MCTVTLNINYLETGSVMENNTYSSDTIFVDFTGRWNLKLTIP